MNYKKFTKLIISSIIPTLSFLIIYNLPVNAQTLMDTTAATSIGSSIDSAPAVNTASIREKIRSEVEVRNQNIRNNQETRNIMVERRIMGSTTPNGSPLPPRLIPGEQERRVVPPGILGQRNASTTRPFMGSTTPPRREPGEREDGKILFGSSTDPRFGNGPRGHYGDGPNRDQASTSPMFGRNKEENRGEIEKRNLEMFRQRKENAAKQFEVAINNLKNLRERIDSRIKKEQQNGKDMSRAKQLLAVADTKLTQLKSSIDALKAFRPATSTNPIRVERTNNDNDSIQSESSTTINTEAGRKLVEDVQRSIKESQKSLNDVIVAIAKSLGVKLGNPNENTSSTSPTPLSSITPAPTASPSTNPQ